jgi:hypothetical protein
VLGFYVPFARVQNCWAKTILWSQTGMFWHFFHLKFSVYCTSEVVLKRSVAVNHHPPVHYQGWMISDLETVFCWVPVP